MINPTQVLADFSASLTFDDLPDIVRHRVVQLACDAIASGLLGQRGEGTTEVAELALALGGEGRSTAIAQTTRLSLMGATLLNGYSITAAGWCDVYLPAHAHITPQVIAPALGLGEQLAVSGRDLVTAIAAGLEATCRIGLGMNAAAFRSKGWHSPGVIGSIGGAATVGRLLGLDGQRMCSAFGVGGSQAAGTMAHWGTPTVKFHQARGALGALIAGLLASRGFRSSPDVLNARDGGVLSTYSDGGDPARIIADLGSTWELTQISTRRWPAGAAMQAPISSTLRLVLDHQIEPAAVREVVVSLPARAFSAHRDMPWDHPLQAQLSPRYLVAAIMQLGRVDMSLFDHSTIGDPTISAFAEGSVRIVEAGPAEGSSVTVTLHDGSVLVDQHRFAEGHPNNPLTDEMLRSKFLDGARDIFSQSEASVLLGELMGIASCANVAPVVAKLAPGSELDRGEL